MIRQYIGARYVVKPYENTLDPSSSAWESGVVYEPLTMVTYNFSTYISKKLVPQTIGDPASNRTYWTLTGYYNGQISVLQNQIDAINAVIADVPNLRSEINVVEDDLTRLQNDGKYIIIFGDSWADPSNADAKISNVFSSAFPDKIVKNYALGGAHWNHATVGFNVQYQTFLADTSFDHDEIAFYVFLAGVGDYQLGTTSVDFITNLQAFVRTAIAHKDRNFYFFADTSMINDTNAQNVSCKYKAQFIYWRDVINNTVMLPHFKAFTTFGWLQCSKTTNHWNTDNWFHPTADGSFFFAKNMVRCIIGEEPVIYQYFHTTARWTPPTGGIGFYNIDCVIQDDRILTIFTVPTDVSYGMTEGQSIQVAYDHRPPYEAITFTTKVAQNAFIIGDFIRCYIKETQITSAGSFLDTVSYLDTAW